jgi:TolB-like protein/DNA-binding winged helix-turn-helix (wHTH) protein
MPQSTKEIYEFAQFRLEVSDRRLYRDGKVVRIADKAFGTLCLLVRRRGGLVTKDELMSAVWPESVVEENNLDQKISTLRGILGERGKGKEKFIETVRGHGYRFLPTVNAVNDPCASSEGKPGDGGQVSPGWTRDTMVERPGANMGNARNVVAIATWQNAPAYVDPNEDALETVGGSSSESNSSVIAAEPLAASSLGSRNWAPRVVLAGGILLGLITIGWSGWSYSTGRPQSGVPSIRSFAVLPFSNETGTPDNEYLADGLTESMIGSLSQVPGLTVKARSSVFRYKGRNIDPQMVGKELSVEGILVGVLSQRGDDLTLSLELVDSLTGNALWSERYHRKMSDIVALQSDIALHVSSKLTAQLPKPDELRIARSYTSDSEANRLYFEGLYYWNKRTAVDIRKSVSLFQRAVDRDPAYAKAHAWLALAYLILPDYSHNLTREDVKELESKRRASMERARQLDGTLAEIYVVSATLKEDVDWDFAGAESDYRRAIELNPNFATAYQAYSRLLGAQGRVDEAIAAVAKAHALDPFSRSIAFNVGGRLADARRFDEAIDQYKRVLEMEPEHPLTHLLLAMAYDARGMVAEAIAAYRTSDVLLEKESTSSADVRAKQLTAAFGVGGLTGYWRKRLEYSRHDLAKNIGSHYKVAVCLARLGERDMAIDQLEHSYAAREPDLVWIRTESAFDAMSEDARVVSLLRQIGVKR